MSYASDLLAQARKLCATDPRRPKQANLRRAVSSAYYGLFHQLIEDAAGFMLPGRRADLRLQMGRKFVHKTMKAVSQATSGSMNMDLAAVAGAFVSLQEARHQADYDFAASFTRFEANEHLARAEDALAKWDRTKSSPEAERFLVELLVGRLDPA